MCGCIFGVIGFFILLSFVPAALQIPVLILFFFGLLVAGVAGIFTGAKQSAKQNTQHTQHSAKHKPNMRDLQAINRIANRAEPNAFDSRRLEKILRK